MFSGGQRDTGDMKWANIWNKTEIQEMYGLIFENVIVCIAIQKLMIRMYLADFF